VGVLESNVVVDLGSKGVGGYEGNGSVVWEGRSGVYLEGNYVGSGIVVGRGVYEGIRRVERGRFPLVRYIGSSPAGAVDIVGVGTGPVLAVGTGFDNRGPVLVVDTGFDDTDLVGEVERQSDNTPLNPLFSVHSDTSYRNSLLAQDEVDRNHTQEQAYAAATATKSSAVHGMGVVDAVVGRNTATSATKSHFDVFRVWGNQEDGNMGTQRRVHNADSVVVDGRSLRGLAIVGGDGVQCARRRGNIPVKLTLRDDCCAVGRKPLTDGYYARQFLWTDDCYIEGMSLSTDEIRRLPAGGHVSLPLMDADHAT